MNRKNISKNLVAVLILMVLVVFVSYYFVFSDIKRRNENTSNLEHDLSLQNKKNEYVSSLEKTFESSDSDIAKINNSIIPKSGDIKFIEDLEALARGNGLTIDIDSSLSFADIPDFQSSGMVLFRVKARTKGSWEGTHKFLAQVESLPLKVLVKSFGLSASVSDNSLGSNSSTQWQSVFEINILKYK